MTRKFRKFDTLDAKLEKGSEDYEISHPNRRQAGQLLTGTQRFKEAHQTIARRRPDVFDDSMKLQYTISVRSGNALLSLYILCKNHSYDAAHGRLRFLLEAYLIIKDLNRNRKKSREKWDQTRRQVRGFETEYEHNWEKLASTEYIYGRVGNLKGELEEEYQELYSYFSSRGSHPQSIRATGLDGSWDSVEEHHLLSMGVIFLFGITSQYAEIFRPTETYWDVRELLDPIFINSRIASPIALPTLFSDEFDKWAPELQ